MPRSMTGYGRGEHTASGHRAVVEVRSVNHRHAEFSIRLTRGYMALEERLRAVLPDRVARGRVDVSVTVEALQGQHREVRVDPELAAGYLHALLELGRRLKMRVRPRLETLIALPEVIAVTDARPDPEAAWPAVQDALAEALDALVRMREREGERLYRDLAHRLGHLGQLMEEVGARAPLAQEEYRQRVAERIAEMAGRVELEPSRIAGEVAVLVERGSIAEELVRVGSHLTEAREALSRDGPVGRRLEFIVQELGRELNTAAAKTTDVRIGKLLLDAREELDKIREQVQNLE